MDITVIGRNAEIHDNFRDYVEEKLAKVTLFYPRAQRVDVELTHERNPRQADTAERIELTVYGKGPVIRAEASSSDRHAAVDLASAKLFERLRRMRDRAKDHRRNAVEPADVSELSATGTTGVAASSPTQTLHNAGDLKPGEIREEQLGDSPVVVRQKLHDAQPMTVDEALDQMELVGHPFFLFVDSATRQPCVVYRRHGWTYGVIRLNARVEI